MDIDEMKGHNKMVMVSTSETAEAIGTMLIAEMKQMGATIPTSEQRLARIDAAIALARGAQALMKLQALILGQTATGTDINDAMLVVDEVLTNVDRRVERYIEARRGDGTDEDFENPKPMALVLIEREEAEKSNTLLDEQSKGLQKALEEGLVVDIVSGDSVIAHHMGLTDKEMMVS